MCCFVNCRLFDGLCNSYLVLTYEKEKEFRLKMLKDFERYNYEIVIKNEKEYEIDKILGKQIVMHLKEFFKTSNKNKTYKKTLHKKNKTYKIKY